MMEKIFVAINSEIISIGKSKKMLRNSSPPPHIVAHLNEQDLQFARTATS